MSITLLGKIYDLETTIIIDLSYKELTRFIFR